MGKAILRLESINHNWGLPPEMLFWAWLLNGGKPLPQRQWVAEITGLSATSKDKFNKHYLRGKIDYSKANSKGTRGVYAYYILEEGRLYEVNSPVAWKRDDHYYCTVKDGQIIRLTEREVQECLRNRSV